MPYQRRKPKMSDLELIGLNLTAEFIGLDSENHLFRNLPASHKSKIERSIYNRRKRKLLYFMKVIRVKMVEKLNENEDCFVVDSMLLEICKMARSQRSKICKEVDSIRDIALRRMCIFTDINCT